MGISNRKMENSGKVLLNEAEAIKKAHKYSNADQLYILLSIRQADMINGISVPYIGEMLDGHKILFIFSSLELAKAYVDFNGYEKLDGIYPIGMIEKNHKYNNLKSICKLATYFGVNYIDFDNVNKAEVFGCDIKWLMQVNHLPIESASMILSEKEFKKITNENDGIIQPHMNPMPIAEFFNSYNITEERANEVLMHVFKGESETELIETFSNKESLFENCYVMDFVVTQMVPRAIKEGMQNDIEYFGKVIGLMSIVIKDKITALQILYTLKDSNSDNLYIKDDSAYLLYTDRFKYMGHFDYIKLNGISDFQKLIVQSNVKRVVVTDGPHSIAVLEARMLLENNQTGNKKR